MTLKNQVYSVCLALLLTSGAAWSQTTEQTAEQTVPLHHLVLVSYAAEATAEQRQQLLDDTLTLLPAIPGVESVSVGRKARGERPVHIADYDLVIHVTLQDESSLDAYSIHPNHLRLMRQNKGSIVGIKVVDFVTDTIKTTKPLK